MIELARPQDAPAVARIINAAYDAGEAGIWQDGWTRTTPEHGRAADRRRARSRSRATTTAASSGPCACAGSTDETAELGMLSVDPQAFGTGAGRALLTFAEQHHGTPFMQLELLVPRGAPHPQKVRLHDWYSRLGYRTDLPAGVRRAPARRSRGPADLPQEPARRAGDLSAAAG